MEVNKSNLYNNLVKDLFRNKGYSKIYVLEIGK